MTVALGRVPLDTCGGYWGIVEAIRDNPPPSLPDDSTFSDVFKDFLSLMMQQNSSKRPSCTVLLEHAFLDQALDEDHSEDYYSEDGIDKLKDIITTLHSHLATIKANSGPQLHDQEESQLCSELRMKSPTEVMRELLFTNFTELSVFDRLAKQLYISPEECMDKIYLILNEIDSASS
jgi:serine/threonine protein kinase